MDHTLHTLDRNVSHERTHYSNVPQETSMSNLFSITSDSLPDIFRKPIIQQQPDIALNLQSKFCHAEDKVSRWGYGPSSSTNAQQGFGAKTIHSESHKELPTKLFAEGHLTLPHVQEELHSFDAPKPCILQTGLHGIKHEDYEWNRLEKSSAFNCKESFVKREKEEPVSTSTKFLDKSDLSTITSDTAIVLGIPTQPTVKMHSMDEPKTPITKQQSRSGLSSFTTARASESCMVSSVSLSKTERQMNDQVPSSNVLVPKPDGESFSALNSMNFKLPLPEKIKSIACIPDVQPIIPNHHHVMQQDKLLAPPVHNNNLLPPQTPRQLPKTKQISVNGKLYTVMKPLGRGGSSVVYQVECETQTFFISYF